jgi:YD repeat-containing protein
LNGWTTNDAPNNLTLNTTLDYNASGYLTRDDASHQGTFAYNANGNQTSETETRPGKPNRVTTRTYNKANWLIETRDPNNKATTYAYNLAGNQTSVIDPAGYTTSITPNALNQPQTAAHRNASDTIIATTNTCDARDSRNENPNRQSFWSFFAF